MSAESQTNVIDLMKDRKLIDTAMGKAIRETVRMHKLLGYPVVSGDGKGNVVIIQPEDIVLEEEKTLPAPKQDGPNV